MRIFEKYVPADYTSYEDFQARCKVRVPENFNYAYDVLDTLADQQPDKPAMLWTNVAGDERRFTFAQMRAKVNQTANYLSQLGIRKGDFVMLILKRHYQFWFCILALHKLGAVAIPATHLLTAKDIVYRCNAADVKMIVCAEDDGIRAHIQDAKPKCSTLQFLLTTGDAPGWDNLGEGIAAQSEEFARPTGDQMTQNLDPMLLYFTSGTTGMPKMVLHNFLYPLGHINTGVFWHQAQADGLHLTVADTGWGKAIWGKLYGQWFAETTVFVYDFDAFDPVAMLELFGKYKITTFCAPPTIYRFFIKQDLSKYDLSSLRHVTIAGEPLNPEVFNQFKQATGLALHEGFGQTETTVSLGTYSPWVPPQPGSMGKPSPGYHVRLLDDKGEDCVDGQVGELCIVTGDAPPVGMFGGYYRDDALTQKVWHDGLYHTGDMAWRNESGYYWYVGRADDVIKSSGYRIGPFEVESALLEHPAVLETAVTGVPHPDRGTVVKATVVLSQGYVPCDALVKDLQTHVKRTTAPYKYPRVIEFVEELPKTISGKIRRVEIREKDTK